VEAGLFGWEALTEIGEVIVERAPKRTSTTQITLYESHGMGIQDLYVAERLVQMARACDLGKDLPI
jgi:alanine dehydrogenase